MSHIVQIVRRIGPGSGVPGVAWHLDREFRAMGHTVETFTYTTAGGPVHAWKRRWQERMAQSARIVWFSTVGTRRARRFLTQRPDAVSICHDDVLAGDIYVNHGLLQVAMRDRGESWWRRVRNPVLAFIRLRDQIRYRSHIHQAIVVLSKGEIETLRSVHIRVRPPISVISNGVDLDVFRPPSNEERAQSRARLYLDDQDRVALFIGHEFDRKGMPELIAALGRAPDVLLLVVGGDGKQISRAKDRAAREGVAERVLFVGPQADLSRYLWAADMFVMPSVYEANGLVYLEALASGLPVIATRVGIAREVVKDGANGFLVNLDPQQIGDRLQRLASVDLRTWRERARVSVQDFSWRAVAERYLTLINVIENQRSG